MLRNVYLKGIYKKSEDRNRKPLSLAISFLLIFGAFIVMLGTVIAPVGQEHNIWGTANEGVLHPGVGVADGRKITAWIDGVTYGYNWTWDTGYYDLYIDGDDWGFPANDNAKDGGYKGDAIVYFLDYNPMDYYLNVSHTTSSFISSNYEHVDFMFFNRTDQAPNLTTLRMLKINEIVLDPDDGLPQYVIVYDPGQNLGMNNITDYYLQKDNNVTHSPEGEIFDFLTHVNDIVDMSNGYYYINLTANLELNDTDELKLVWKSPYTPHIDPALTGPGNGTDIIIDRVEWGNYANYINPITPPDDRDYDNTTLLDFINTSSLNGSGASMIRTDDKFSSGYSGNGTDTDDCFADFKVLGKGTSRPHQYIYPVHNIHTNDYFSTIQESIDDPDTQDGHTIEVAAGTYTENVVVNKTINLTGEDRVTTIIDGGGSGTIIKIDADWVNVSGFSVINGFSGISAWSTSNQRITNNNISFNSFAIRISFSENDSIINNEMIENGIEIYGTKLQHWNTHNIDSSNTVNGKPVYYRKNQNGGTVPSDVGQVLLANCTGMTIEYHSFSKATTAVGLGFSSNNSIFSNSFDINYLHGIYLSHSTGNNITGNNLLTDNNAIYLDYSNNNDVYQNNISGVNGHGVFVYNSDRNTIWGNRISDINLGIGVSFSVGNNITHNTLSYLQDGITLNKGAGNNISKNTILLSSGCGISISTMSPNNMIYHNNFIGNTNQASDDTNNGNQWDNDYPAGGNFWSNYTGPDEFSGPSQNINGNDGIGDTNYSIDSDSIDNYPLMLPIGPNIFLYGGWNLISLLNIQSDSSIGTVLSPITGSYDAIQWLNVTDPTDPWKHNSISKPPHLNDLENIDHTMGFWIHNNDPGGVLFEYPGTKPTSNQSITLHPGWNMVGYPSLSNRNRTAALNNIVFDQDVDAIWTFNAATQTWQEIGPSDSLEPGRGYWIHSKVTKIWDVPL